MNSPNLVIDGSTSPMTEAENINNDEGKQWNKSFDKKAPSDPRLASSPRMEPGTSPLIATKNFLRQNGQSTKKKLRLDEEEYESLEMACNLASEMPDDCDAFGKHVAAQLRLMTKMQKFMAQRLISEVCFRGQIQHLSLNTNITNVVSAQHQQQPAQPQPPAAQPHIQNAIFPHRPSHITATMYGRTPDYLLLHQQGIRPSTALQPFQNFMQPQSDHSSVPLEQVGTSYSNP